MITQLDIQVEKKLFDLLLDQIPKVDFKLTLNTPTGDFFYDPWVISEEFKNTPWEEILNTLGCHIGEARIIKLSEKECYMAHSDIDNRWHFSLVTGKSFLVDIESAQLYTLVPGYWYYMDAGRDHSAVNFGGCDRIQLVVRELLNNSNLLKPQKIIINPIENLYNIRYIFDTVYSPWLNKINKAGLMRDFKIIGNSVSLTIESNVEIPQHTAFEIICE